MRDLLAVVFAGIVLVASPRADGSAQSNLPPVPSQPISLQGVPVKGSRSARVAIIEYADFQCPYCALFFRYTMPDLDRLYIKTGKVMFAFWHSPLDEIHPRAMRAAEAGECASRQGRFWEMHDALFDDQLSLDDRSLSRRAVALGLDTARFATCMNGQAAETVHRQRDAAARLGIDGTPAYFIGTVQPDGTVRVTDRLIGAQRAASFQAILDPLLARTARP